MARSSLFSKTIALLFLLGVHPARAVNLHALYTASCQREVGVILNVSPRKISLLSLTGRLVTVERFEVIYYATYPLDSVPITAVANPEEVPLVRVKTFQNGELRDLLLGWPVDFSQDKISFLTLRGTEVIIDRRSIWEISYDQRTTPVQFSARSRVGYDFTHPYAFSGCPTESSRSVDRLVHVYPQQLLSDPVAIKRELDRLELGHNGVRKYSEDQQFYPVPEVYTNETTLGLWLMTGSRYGASGNRKNNFTPFLVNQFSGGPFGFQSEFRTGSGPLLQSLHEETQTQIYYRMKADYFHFSGMVDPSVLLVGLKYKWFANDLDGVDIRSNDSALLEFGFDYGRWGFELFLGAVGNLGARRDSLFVNETVSSTRIGLRYQSYQWLLNIIGGNGRGENSTLSLLRFNLEWIPDRNKRLVFSTISRDLRWDGPEPVSQQRYMVEGRSLTFAGYGYWRYKSRYWAGLMLAVERLEKQSGLTSFSDSENKIYPKLGGLISLSF